MVIITTNKKKANAINYIRHISDTNTNNTNNTKQSPNSHHWPQINHLRTRVFDLDQIEDSGSQMVDLGSGWHDRDHQSSLQHLQIVRRLFGGNLKSTTDNRMGETTDYGTYNQWFHPSDYRWLDLRNSTTKSIHNVSNFLIFILLIYFYYFIAPLLWVASDSEEAGHIT